MSARILNFHLGSFGSPETNLPTDSLNNVTGLDDGPLTVFWDDPPDQLDPSNNTLNPFDVVFIGGVQLPGICRIRSKKHKEYDVKKSKGTQGATLTYVGYNPSEVIVENRIWTSGQLNQLYQMIPMLTPKITQQTPLSDVGNLALDIYHPVLFMYGIFSVVIIGLDPLEPTETKGVWQQRIHFLEYIPKVEKQNVTHTVNGSQKKYNVKSANLGQPAAQPPPSADPVYTGPLSRN